MLSFVCCSSYSNLSVFSLLFRAIVSRCSSIIFNLRSFYCSNSNILFFCSWAILAFSDSIFAFFLSNSVFNNKFSCEIIICGKPDSAFFLSLSRILKQATEPSNPHVNRVWLS